MKDNQKLIEELGGSCIIPVVYKHRDTDYDDIEEYATCMK